MMASRGMGAVNASKMSKPKVIKKRDGDYPVDVYAEGGKVGLYANINAKKKRIANGSKERMRKVGSKGAPTAQAFINSAKTAKK
jgi:hypothetical protein